MTRADVRELAPQWGSLIAAGDPGACMYGDVDDAATRRAMLAHLDRDLLPDVEASPADYDAGSLDELKAMRARLAEWNA